MSFRRSHYSSGFVLFIVALCGMLPAGCSDISPASIPYEQREWISSDGVAGVQILTKGAPIQPGNNFTIGYHGATPVCAVPAAALFHQVTALDIFLPRLLAGDRITAGEIFALGHGGLCLQCPDCTFPVCTFGRG